MTDWLNRAAEGFAGLDFDQEAKDRALATLGQWLDRESLADCRPQLHGLIERGAFAHLFDAFWQTIPFGTGGRRGPVGMGSNRFNSWTLLTSVQGHAEILRETFPGEDVAVVIAYDVRVFQDLREVYDRDLPNPLLGLSSADFAAQAAGVYVANGVKVAMLDPAGDTYMSTPELSLAIRRHGAHGGLNVSASHNHPDDNGGKFYNRHGGQDVPPHDETLARRVEGITEIRSQSFEEAVSSGAVTLLGEDENAHYLNVNRRLSLRQDRGGRIVFTPLHGTGAVTVGRLLRAEGFEVLGVPSQEGFDGGFPGVKFLAPNPEVPSCYEAAQVVADEADADIILSTDPDADRIGLEVKHDGAWRFVTGNEIGVLVARHVLEERRRSSSLPEDALVLKTLVTTSLITTIARSYGCQVVGDLMVGFKYMGDILATLEQEGVWGDVRARADSFVLGLEESHGLLLTSAIRDKDAGGAALALAELNAVCVAEGRTLVDELDAIHRRFGYVSNTLFTTIMTGATGLARIRAIQASLREQPPEEVAGRAVVHFEDMADPEGRLGPLLSGTDAASRNVLVVSLEGDARIVIRPSGTEPKNKIYVEVPGVTPSDDLSLDELAAERARCDREAEELGRAFELLMLARVGIEITPAASRVSNLLGLDEKVDFGTRFLPELERRLAAEESDLEGFLDEALASYGKEPRELVAPGVMAWLESGSLPQEQRDRVKALFAS